MTRVARVRAQAKINIFLHVLGLRPDGYHQVTTMFQRVELADDVTIRASDAPDRSLDVRGARVPANGLGPANRNLAYRAAEEFHAHTGWPRGFEIELTKHIPVGGGLGGGSADAGAVLRALNTVAPEPLDADGLHAVAARLGADVAFLASEHLSALASGRGERLSSAWSGLPQAEVLLVVPSFGVSTAEAYGWLRESGLYDPDPAEHSIATFRSAAGSPGFPGAPRWAMLDWGNTFERVVEPRHPELRAYRERLAALGASIARLSGSGSTVYGLFEQGVPDARDLGIDALVLPTRTAADVVQVEVLE